MNAKPVFSNSDVRTDHVNARDATARAPFQFSVRTLLTLVTLAGMLCGLLSLVGMWISRSRETARQNSCQSAVRSVCVAVDVHEKTVLRFPLATTSANGLLVDQPADARGMGTDAGYGWWVRAMSYRCEKIACKNIWTATSAYALPAFDPSARLYSGIHPSCMQFCELPCPSFTGRNVADVKLAPEYALTQPVFSEGVALSNYVAIAGTHMEAGDVVENGMLVSGKANHGEGLRVDDVSDGLANTMIFTESRERGYASWYDGTCAWVVGVPDGFAASDSDGDGRLDMQRSPITAINYGSDDGSKVYLRAGTWSGQNARRWGPSSEHTGGRVVHGFADVHAVFLTAKIDPTVYMQLITRAGGEPVTGGDLLERP